MGFTQIRITDHRQLQDEAKRFGIPMSRFVSVLLHKWLQLPDKAKWQAITSANQKHE